MGPMCFTALQCTWGAPQTLLGLPVFLAGRARGWPVRRYGGAVVSAWGGSSGMSLGLFVFVPALPAPGAPPQEKAARLLRHEYGHCRQSLVLGPLYLPVVALPSAVWFNLPALRRWRQRTGFDYYRFYTERWADAWAPRAPKTT